MCSWFWDTRLLWADCYQLPCNMATPPLVRVLYCVEMGYYLQVTLIETALAVDLCQKVHVSLHHGCHALFFDMDECTYAHKAAAILQA